MTRQVSFVLVAITATFAVQVMVLILVPLKAAALGVPASTAVALVATWGLLGMVIDIPGSALSDAVGRRWVIAVGGTAMAVAAVMLAIATDLAALLAGMVVFGLGQALSFGPALAFLTEVASPAEHDKVQGVNGAAQGVSGILGALLAGLFAQLGYGIAFVPVFVLAVIVMASVLATPESLARPSRARNVHGLLGSYKRALRMTVRRPPVAFASLLSVLYAIVFLVVAASTLPLVLVEIEGYSPALAGALIAFRNLVAAALSLTFAAVTRRYGLARTVVRLELAGDDRNGPASRRHRFALARMDSARDPGGRHGLWCGSRQRPREAGHERGRACAGHVGNDGGVTPDSPDRSARGRATHRADHRGGSIPPRCGHVRPGHPGDANGGSAHR